MHILRALQCLRPSGPKSFERLVADLLEELTENPFRLCASGTQAGVDAVAEGIALQMKRYDAASPPLAAELERDLARAIRSYPDLDVWGLALTTDLSAQSLQCLEQVASEGGIGLLVLDAAPARPFLADVTAIEALCATSPRRVLEVVQNRDWFDPAKSARMPPCKGLKEELSRIASQPRFGEWVARTREKVHGLPTWFRLRERLNRQLADDIAKRASLSFGTEFSADTLVHRTVTESLDDWLRQSLTTPSEHLKPAMLVGERYDGKTWCVFDWLLHNLARFQLPVFFIPSRQGDGQQVDIREVIRKQIQEALVVTSGRASALLQRFASNRRGDRHWGLVVLDGLNEYRLDPAGPERHLTSLLAERVNVDRRPALVLSTVREAWWLNLPTSSRTKARRISIGGFDDRELADALDLTGVNPGDFGVLAPSTQHLARRPRFFRLWADHRHMLGEFSSVTTDVLIYLDAFDKARNKSHLGRIGWDHHAFSNFLRDLARTFHERSLRDTHLERGAIGEILGKLTPEWFPALRDLEFEGVLKERGGTYEVAPEQLSLGMGLWISAEIRAAAAQGRDLGEAIRDCIEPSADSDEKVAWLRAAVMVELVEQAHGRGRPALVAVLADHWLRSRNLLPEDTAQLQSVSAAVFPALLELAPRAWSHGVGNERLQEISLICFGEAACRPQDHPHRQLLLSRVRSWARTIPERGTRFVRGEDPTAVIRERLTERGVDCLRLVTGREDGYQWLHRVTLYLESLSPGLLRPDDVLCRVAIEKVADSPLVDGEFLVIRRVLRTAPKEWFRSQCRAPGSDLWNKILHRLVLIAERSDLQDLEGELRPLEYTEWEAWNRGMSTFERQEYLDASQKTGAEGEPRHFIRRSRFLVRDPDLPRPCAEVLRTIRTSLARELLGTPLQLHRASTAQDHSFDDATTVLSAWLPELGAEIVQRQMRDLPRRFKADTENSETWWALSIGRHAVLVRDRTRRLLAGVVKEEPAEQQEAFHVAQVLLALIPGMKTLARLEALLGHTLPHEWSTLYRALASSSDQSLRRALVSKICTETDSTRLKRLRLLAVELGDIEMPRSALAGIERDLNAPDGERCFAALASGVHGRVDRLPGRRLLEVASQEDQRSLAPRYAAWMLVHQGENLDDLPLVWQAAAAERFPERRESFLQQMEKALTDSLSLAGRQRVLGPSDETVVQGIQIRRSGGDSPSPQHRFSAPPQPTTGVLFSSRLRGIGGSGETEASGGDILELFDADSATEKRNQLAREAATAAATHSRDLRTAWREEVFPQALVDSLPVERFEGWCGLLIADPVRAGIWWGGVLRPLFVRALSEGRRIALQLWPLLAPFARGPTRPEIRFICDGIDWVLHVLADPSMDDELASELLERLVLDCRSDLELFEVILGARFRDPRRLSRLVTRLLSSEDVETRERAVRLAGWLGGFEETLKVAGTSDPSLGVRRMAEAALQDVDEESWAHYWLDAFLRGESPEERWGAGQLFLACADRRVETWARERLTKVKETRRRGEGHLLLEATGREMDQKDRKLRDRFLAFKVRELTDTCYPWQGKREWSSLHESASPNHGRLGSV